jgi:hypothetical protein
MNKGDRAGAILSSGANEIQLLGYGVYEGEEVPPDGPGMLNGLHMAKVPNPKIKLDNGDIVWGCECWWGPEEEIKKEIGTRKVVMVGMKETYKRHDEMRERVENTLTTIMQMITAPEPNADAIKKFIDETVAALTDNEERLLLLRQLGALMDSIKSQVKEDTDADQDHK